MKIPHWAPSELANASELFEQQAKVEGADVARCMQLSGMWFRLLTRPDMETVWPWISRTKTSFQFFEPYGFVYQFGVAVENFYACPRLSEKAYAKEMREIAALASILAERLERLEARMPYGVGDPFSPHKLLPTHLADPYQVTEPNEFNPEQSLLHHRLASVTITEHLRYLEKAAEVEEKEQHSRLRVSRKANDFRTYLIREVAAYFLWILEEAPPSKIATICSVALDDPDVTPDLVRKIAREALI